MVVNIQRPARSVKRAVAGIESLMMAVFSLCSVGAVFGYAIFRYGGVLPVDWLAALAAIGLIAAAYWLVSKRAELAPAPSRSLRWLLFAFLAAISLQLVPLPVELVRLVSPARAELHANLAPVIPAGAFTTLSVVPAETFRHLLTVLGYAVLFLLVREWCWKWRQRPWVVAAPFVTVAFLEAVLGLVQTYWAGAPLARGTYVNRNHFAGLLEMSLPFAVMPAVAVFRRVAGRRKTPAGPAILACALLAVAAVMLLAVVQSLSRMGFLAVLASLFVMGAAALGAGAGTWKRKLPVVAVAVSVLLGFIFLPTDPLILRFADLAETEDISADTRARIWRESTALVADFPLAGCGLGGYESAFMRYKTVAPMQTVDFAHNDYLQLLAELGVLGFSILLVLAARMFWNALRASALPAGELHRYVGIACAGSLTAIALHSIVDFNLYIPANGMLAVWVAGISEGLSFPGRAGRRKPGFPVYVEG